jgi:hypothetical protein
MAIFPARGASGSTQFGLGGEPLPACAEEIPRGRERGAWGPGKGRSWWERCETDPIQLSPHEFF